MCNINDETDIRKKLQVTCGNCSLNELCIPRGLAKEDVERIAGIVHRRRTLRRGEYIYRKGDRFRGLLAIKSGSAKLLTLDQAGNEYLTGYLLPGELIGFDGLAEDRHACSAIAVETMSYCELPSDQLDALCKEVPKLMRELFRHAGQSLVSETGRNLLSKRPAEERVAGFLIDLSDRLGKRGFSQTAFRLTLTRQEIGNYLGLALETVSRILNAFEQEGVMIVNNKEIQITDLERLREKSIRY